MTKTGKGKPPKEPTDFDRLSDFDKMLMAAILKNPAIKDPELGKMFGVHRQTIQAHRNRPLFKLVLQQQLAEASKDALTLLTESTPKALRFLVSTMHNQNAPWTARVTAARTIVEKGLPDNINLNPGEAEKKPDKLEEVYGALKSPKAQRQFLELAQDLFYAGNPALLSKA